MYIFERMHVYVWLSANVSLRPLIHLNVTMNVSKKVLKTLMNSILIRFLTTPKKFGNVSTTVFLQGDFRFDNRLLFFCKERRLLISDTVYEAT